MQKRQTTLSGSQHCKRVVHPGGQSMLREPLFLGGDSSHGHQECQDNNRGETLRDYKHSAFQEPIFIPPADTYDKQIEFEDADS